MAMAWPGCMLHQMLSLSSVLYRFRSMELPATTVGDWWRRQSPGRPGALAKFMVSAMRYFREYHNIPGEGTTAYLNTVDECT